jgi:hypothetical protein
VVNELEARFRKLVRHTSLANVPVMVSIQPHTR